MSRPSIEKLLEKPWHVLAVLLPLSLLLALPAVNMQFGGKLLDLLPDRPVARAFARALEGVSAGDVDLVLVEGHSADEVRRAGDLFAETVATKPTVAAALARVPITTDPTPSALFRALATRGDDATLAGLRERFSQAGAYAAGSRILTMALAPGGGAVRDLLVRDPYDLAPLLVQRLRHLGAGVRPGADGAIVSADGLARLIVVRGRGSAFDYYFPARLAADVQSAMNATVQRVPGVRIRWTGPHAIAWATGNLIRKDLQYSSVLASVLVALIFILAMRRVRALIGVAVPLAIGTAWTSALAVIALKGLNAISIAFGAIVLGVGLDTGVHLYDRVLEERRHGLPPAQAAAKAVRDLGWPVMSAAITAAAAFASLYASELRALRELGILAAAGEVLTAIAIILLTPPLAAALERGTPPKVGGADRAWPRLMGSVAGGRATPMLVVIGLMVIGGSILFGPRPQLADAVVLVRPKALEPLEVQHDIFAHFGGEPGQWNIVGEAPTMERALETSEALERVLAPLEQRGLLTGFDTVSALAPSLANQRARYEQIRALDPARAADQLSAALAARGARVEMFEPGLSALRAPLPEPVAMDPLSGPSAGLAQRFVARRNGHVVFLSYVRPSSRLDMAVVRAEVTRAITSVDPTLELTGGPLIEADVRAALRADTLRVGGIASALVMLLLFVSLRSARRVVLALSGVAVEILALFAFLGVCRIKLDAYNLLAVPVLVGITIDEIVFVIHAYEEATGTPAERARVAVQHMTSATTATAAATAAGFLALAICRFDALRGLGIVAGVGTMLGLLCAIVVVPAFARILSVARPAPAAPVPAHTETA